MPSGWTAPAPKRSPSSRAASRPKASRCCSRPATTRSGRSTHPVYPGCTPRASQRALPPRHQLVRSAVYRGETSQARRAVEQALADALDAVKDRDRRAWHRANAAIGPDDTIATELAHVGDRASDRGGHVGATAAYQRAAEMTTDEDTRASLLADAAQAAWLAGRPDEARDLLDLAAPAGTDAPLRGRIAH